MNKLGCLGSRMLCSGQCKCDRKSVCCLYCNLFKKMWQTVVGKSTGKLLVVRKVVQIMLPDGFLEKFLSGLNRQILQFLNPSPTVYVSSQIRFFSQFTVLG